MAAAPPSISYAPLVPVQSSWTFTQGLLFGQASFVALVLLFIRYVVFQRVEEQDEVAWRARRDARSKQPILSTQPPIPPTAASLLQKTAYEMSSHGPESTDWLNVVLAQILQGYRNDLLSSGGEEGARVRIEKWLNPPGKKSSWLDPIKVQSLSLGRGFPLLSHARVRPADGKGAVRVELDLDYADSTHLSLSTSVLINVPRPRFAVLPVSLGVELIGLGGTMTMAIHDPPNPNERQHLHLSLLPDFHLNVKVTSLVGSRAKLQDIPKIEQLVIARLRAVIQDRLVYPNHLSFGLPKLLSPALSASPILEGIDPDHSVQPTAPSSENGIDERDYAQIPKPSLNLPKPEPISRPSYVNLPASAQSTATAAPSPLKFRGQFASHPSTPMLGTERRLGHDSRLGLNAQSVNS